VYYGYKGCRTHGLYPQTWCSTLSYWTNFGEFHFHALR
jgi:hypothetical protein